MFQEEKAGNAPPTRSLHSLTRRQNAKYAAMLTDLALSERAQQPQGVQAAVLSSHVPYVSAVCVVCPRPRGAAL